MGVETKQSPAEKIMKSVTVVSAVCTMISIWLYQSTDKGIWLTMGITAGTFFYHFAMRLMVGLTVRSLVRKPLNYKTGWLLLRPWEPEFYRKIKIKQWKNKLPTYYPQDFSLKNHSARELLQTMCISEIGHEIMLILSFLPLLLTIWFGEFAVFLMTSLGAGAIDLVFVLIQRYNRNRLMKYIDLSEARRKKRY